MTSLFRQADELSPPSNARCTFHQMIHVGKAGGRFHATLQTTMGLPTPLGQTSTNVRDEGITTKPDQYRLRVLLRPRGKWG